MAFEKGPQRDPTSVISFTTSSQVSTRCGAVKCGLQDQGAAWFGHVLRESEARGQSRVNFPRYEARYL